MEIALTTDQTMPPGSYDMKPSGDKELVVSITGSIGSFGVPHESIRQAVMLADDDSFMSLRLRINSPGGTLNGIDGVLEALNHVASRKMVVCDIDGVCTSLAYWIASQCDVIRAGRLSYIGDIGAQITLVDSSSRMSSEGLKIHVIKSNPEKAQYVDGLPVSDEFKAQLQGRIDFVAQHFVADVAKLRGRWADSGMPRGVYSAPEALELGLIDEVIEGDRMAKDEEVVDVTGEDKLVEVSATSEVPNQEAAVETPEVKAESASEEDEEEAEGSESDEVEALRAENEELRAKLKEHEEKAEANEGDEEKAESDKGEEEASTSDTALVTLQNVAEAAGIKLEADNFDAAKAQFVKLVKYGSEKPSIRTETGEQKSPTAILREFQNKYGAVKGGEMFARQHPDLLASMKGES
jgi:ClpP class serine protease